MGYLKVPELYTTWYDEIPFSPYYGHATFKGKQGAAFDPLLEWLANLINAVYTPTTGLLAQLEDQRREIEELRRKVLEMSTKH